MRPEETKLRELGKMSRPLLEKKWALERALTCLHRREDELREQKVRVDKLNEDYIEALQSALADEPSVRRLSMAKGRTKKAVPT